MKRNPATLLAAVAFLSSSSSNALPFRNRRHQQQNDNDDDTAESSTCTNRNAAVDAYVAAAASSSNNSAAADSNHFESPPSVDLYHDIRSHAADLQPWLIQHRRHLHQIPELMYYEAETSAYIQSVLEELQIPYSAGWAVNIHASNSTSMNGPGGYGIVADIGTGQEPCVLLRADMDALPITEETPVDFAADAHLQKMHACGHDGHTTMLLGAASLLKSMEHSLNGTVRLLFQPAEEGGAGAKRMIEEGLLEKHPQPQHAMGLHLWPTLPSGTIATRPGPLLAACERFQIVLEGVGGHAAMPHLTVDPIVAASSLVMNLQTIVSRTVSPLESGVVSITQFQAGQDVFNVIPSTVLLKGTIRALSTETLLQLREKVQHMVESTAAVHGCTVAQLEYSHDYYPPTVNDPDLYHTFSQHVGALVSREDFVRDDTTTAAHIDPTMGAEDFAFLAQEIPSTFYLLGQGSGHGPRTDFGLHHPQFALDESVLSQGVELHVNWAVRALEKLRANQ